MTWPTAARLRSAWPWLTLALPALVAGRAYAMLRDGRVGPGAWGS